MNVLILMGATAAYIYSITGWIFNYNSLQVHHYLFLKQLQLLLHLYYWVIILKSVPLLKQPQH